MRAVQLLIRCRRTLAFTFVYAFFIKDDRARKLFEFAQGELEKYTASISLPPSLWHGDGAMEPLLFGTGAMNA